MATTSTAFRQLSDGNSVGTLLGISAADLIGFYGVTTAVAQFTVSTAVSQSISSGALASTIAFQLNRMGFMNISTIAA